MVASSRPEVATELASLLPLSICINRVIRFGIVREYQGHFLTELRSWRDIEETQSVPAFQDRNLSFIVAECRRNHIASKFQGRRGEGSCSLY
jgi:hypothetical protein